MLNLANTELSLKILEFSRGILQNRRNDTVNVCSSTFTIAYKSMMILFW